MSHAYRISLPKPQLRGVVSLETSKSISNRILIIRSLCDENFDIQGLSTSDDTKSLVHMLSSESDVLHSGHAGSSYRFMVARACLGTKEVKLDGSTQLKKRPVGTLVKALQTLAAEITYLEKEGFPPLLIRPTSTFGSKSNEVHLQAGISSQYVTALLLIAPYLQNGLKINLSEDPVSVPYIQMTLTLMKFYGVEASWSSDTITIQPGKYSPKSFTVEGDWSAASYYYSLVALCPSGEITVQGLTEDSLQGDSHVKEIYTHLGVETTFFEGGIHLKKIENFQPPKEIKVNFNDHPDLAQTVMVTLAGLGVKGLLSGLKTLRIKETDRITAMQTELAKVKVLLDVKVEDGDLTCVLTGKAKWKDKAKFDTYEDHRMAMSVAPLACINPIIIRDADVVNKSYPGFWRDVKSIGLNVETRF